MYDHFCVTHCNYKLTFTPYTTATSAGISVGALVTGGVLTTTEITEILEQPLVKSKVLYGG
jgi:expansin (peptidoglycan-binding protein)